MTKDFEKDESFSIITERSSGRYPAKEGIDHLTYLEERHSIFAHEKDDRMREWQLVCASCGHLVTKVAEKVDVRGRHDHDFPYYSGVVRLGCYRDAPGCVGIDRISNGYSWFRGYSWQIQLCSHCSVSYTHLTLPTKRIV